MNIPDYKLSAVLCGHSLDVRCVATTKEDCILSASRDRTAKLWHPEGVKDFTNVVTYKGHKNFVSSVVWMHPCEAYPDGLVITGSNDNTILGYNLQDGSVLLTIKAHDNAVSSVSCCKEPGMILSSSWDNMAKLWNVSKPDTALATFKGHEAAVWAIIELGDGTIASASADKTIILWNKQASKLKTLAGHSDCVRDLVMASPETFLSCSNDASVKLWKNSGECLNTYYGHSNYVYSIALNPALGPTGFVSCGEDSTVRVWQAGDCVGTLALPAQSVWSVTCLNNGDIIAGTSDGIVRVFSKDPARYADDGMLAVYEQEVQKLVDASKQEIGGFKLSELPGPEVLLEPGKTDGQTKLVRRGTNVKCYSWSAAKQTWDELGDVMGSNPTDGKTMYQGKEYDFVFSVDIEDGKPPLKLPYNNGEDPWVSAQAFIHSNQLPQVYLDQVANFIVKNAKLDTLPASSNGMADPFTGESRYVPGSNTTTMTGPAQDPFTGSGAYTTAAAQVNATSNGKPLIPHDSYLRFDQANLNQIREKLKEFNQKNGDGLNSLTDDQLQDIVKLGDTNPTASNETINVLKTLFSWPKEILFPVLDIARLAVRNKEINSCLFDGNYGPEFIKFLLTLLTPDNIPANQMLALRVFVNAFAHLPGEMMALAAQESIVHSLICLTKLNKNTQVATTTLLLNLSVALGQQTDNVDLAECIIQTLSKVNDNEAYFRGLVALGTLVAESPNRLPLQTKIVSNTAFLNKLKQDCISTTNQDPNVRKISICSQQIVQLL